MSPGRLHSIVGSMRHSTHQNLLLSLLGFVQHILHRLHAFVRLLFRRLPLCLVQHLQHRCPVRSSFLPSTSGDALGTSTGGPCCRRRCVGWRLCHERAGTGGGAQWLLLVVIGIGTPGGACLKAWSGVGCGCAWSWSWKRG